MKIVNIFLVLLMIANIICAISGKHKKQTFINAFAVGWIGSLLFMKLLEVL